MPTVLDRLLEGIGAVILLHLLAMLFVDRAQLKSCLVDLCGYRDKVRVFFRGPASDRAFWVLLQPSYWVCALASFVWPSPVHQHAPWQPWQKAAFGLFAVIVAMFMVLAKRRLNRWESWFETFQVSRGELFDGVSKIGRRSGAFKSIGPEVYVLPGVSEARPFASRGITILLPRPLLDCMSRLEIDALAARQICRQSKPYWSPPFWTLLACDAAAVGLAEWLLPGWAVRVAALALLLVLQFAALARYLPRALARTDWRAAQLTGDYEAFLSSMAGLARFTGTPLDEEAIREIARQGGVPAERIPELLSERTVPAGERYPTRGAYTLTGLG